MTTQRSPHDYHFHIKDALVGMQFLFVAFGALVLVPILTGLNPSVALFGAGLGTLAFQLIMKFLGKSEIPPIFLASSFAFIAPIGVGVQQWGIAGTMSGLIAAGLFYVVFSFIIRFAGTGFLNRLLPPTVIGPVIMSIGLILSPVAVNMALGRTADGTVIVPKDTALLVSFTTLAAVLVVSIIGKKMWKLVPILVGIVVGYTLSFALGIVDLSKVSQAAWFSVPEFTTPKLNWEAVFFIMPIAIAPVVEHIGDMLAISGVTGRNYLQKPGLHNTLLGDGVATILASAIGAPPNTTYSEVTGAVTMIKAFNPAIMTWAAIFAIVLAFSGKLGALLGTIPMPVMGGIMLLLFGIITVVGIKSLANVDLNCPRNIAIVAIILVFAIGGMSFEFGGVGFSGIGLGAISGIILNLLLPRASQEPSSEEK